jgi:protein-S-isoprenylcysteine O-methyltransferase Ste14
VVESGPYGLVRHPIYTGFLGASWAFALLIASPTALLGAALLTVQMAWKAKREESFLRQELGPADYDAYAARTPMLIPLLRRPG